LVIAALHPLAVADALLHRAQIIERQQRLAVGLIDRYARLIERLGRSNRRATRCALPSDVPLSSRLERRYQSPSAVLTPFL
jgi:hypothetical protein